MKNVYLIGALGGLLLTSCANDDLVVKPVAPTTDSQAAIAFQMKVGNMSRAPQALNEVMDNFGVWSFKANSAADLRTSNIGSGLEVMPNYRVNYEKAEAYGSHWNYVTADWANSVADPTVTPTANLQQFLKYWDGSVDYTYFFAYGPHWTDIVKTDAAPKADYPTLAFDATKDEATLTFPEFVTSAEPTKNFIYADARRENNKEHVNAINAPAGGTTDNPTKVPLTFHRVFSQVNIAIYEEIPGYSVEMKSLTFSDGTTAGIAAIPANYTPKAATKWARGKYLNAGQPVVVYSEDATKNPAVEFGKTTLAYNEAKMGTATLDFELPAGTIGTTKANATPSASHYNVIPNYNDPDNPGKDDAITMADGTETWAANSGLQFVMNYVLKSQDTSEEINVKGARVYVTPEYTNWKANTIYTYIFKITTNSSGTTTNDDPDPDPDDPENALYPIIFDQVVITNADNAEQSEWLVNGVEFQTPAKTLTMGTDASFTIPYIYDGLELTWTSSDTSVATVADGVVTPVGAGRATITATTPNNATATCVITVVPAEGFALLQTSVSVETDASVQIDFVEDDADTDVPTWTSSDETVATVDANGVVTGKKAGTSTITVTYGSATIDPNTVTVTVTDPS